MHTIFFVNDGCGGLLFAVRFRFVVFRPFIDEIIVGRIRSSSAEGVKGMLASCSHNGGS